MDTVTLDDVRARARELWRDSIASDLCPACGDMLLHATGTGLHFCRDICCGWDEEAHKEQDKAAAMLAELKEARERLAQLQARRAEMPEEPTGPVSEDDLLCAIWRAEADIHEAARDLELREFYDGGWLRDHQYPTA